MNNKKYIYFIGIGGIGMSALAQYAFSIGKIVQGYDKSPSNITDLLHNIGINSIFEDEPASLPSWLMPNASKNEVLIVRTPAVPATSKILQYCQNNGFEIIKRSQLLGILSQDMPTIAIGGTHGKTTTSALLAHIAYTAKINFTAILGGIATNFNSNWLTTGKDWLITEADEYDRSFLYLRPQFAAITSTDADHLDIYHTHENLIEAYQSFANLTLNTVLIKYGIGIKAQHGTKTLTYGIENGDYAASNIQVNNGAFCFNLKTPNNFIENVVCGLPGKHNIENAVAAIALALEAGFDLKSILNAVASFKGVKRRFEVVFKTSQYCYIDDYAHHPEEITALINAVRMLYPTQTIVGIFQPHLFSRTLDFGAEFGIALSALDKVYLLPIYPARELPMPNVTSVNNILPFVNCEKVAVSNFTELFNSLEHENAPIWLSIGAGDIGQIVPTIGEILQKKGAEK